MFGELRVLLFVCFRSVHGWMGMDVWMNVLRMPFLFADSGTWRKMSILGSCWSQKGKGYCGFFEKGHYCRAMFFYLLNTFANGFCQYCPRREGLRHWSSAEEHRHWSSAEEHLPSFLTVDRHHTGQERTTKRRCHVWWVESFALCFSSVHGWMGMAVWVNVFPMPYLCIDSGPWRKMSGAWFSISAIMTPSGTTCPCHQES